MRAHPKLVIKEQGGLLNIIGANRIQTPAPTNQTPSRNTEPTSNTEGARQIGSRFTRDEWELIYRYGTRNLSSRQTDAEITDRFRRFYARFGPQSPLRTPQEYGAGLQNFRIPVTITTFQWNYILANLQNLLRQAQQWQGSEEGGRGGDLSDDEILELGRALQRATRGANFNEGEIIYNIRALRTQNDYNRLLQVYTSLDTVGRNLEEVLSQLNVAEKQTIARELERRGITPGPNFDAGRTETEPQFDVYNLPIDDEQFPNEGAYTADQAQRYTTEVLNQLAQRLGTGEGETGLQFFNFVRSDAPTAVEFRQRIEEMWEEGISRRQLNIRIAALLRTVWPVFELAQENE